MILMKYLNEQFTVMQNLDFFIRLLAACLCGACIGFERSKRLKEAGIRTHLIVCCAAALFMIISKYGFVDLQDAKGEMYNGVRGADPARIAAQVISGVSFLGAGAIFHNKNYTRGLTTAAGIWATAGIGLAIGAGMIKLGAFATVLITIVQVIMHFFSYGPDSYAGSILQFEVNDKAVFRQVLREIKEETQGLIAECNVVNSKNGITSYRLVIRSKEEISLEAIDILSARHPEILGYTLKNL